MAKHCATCTCAPKKRLRPVVRKPKETFFRHSDLQPQGPIMGEEAMSPLGVALKRELMRQEY